MKQNAKETVTIPVIVIATNRKAEAVSRAGPTIYTSKE